MLRVGLGRHIGSPQADSPQSVSRHIDLHQTREMPNGVVRRGLDASTPGKGRRRPSASWGPTNQNIASAPYRASTRSPAFGDERDAANPQTATGRKSQSARQPAPRVRRSGTASSAALAPPNNAPPYSETGGTAISSSTQECRKPAELPVRRDQALDGRPSPLTQNRAFTAFTSEPSGYFPGFAGTSPARSLLSKSSHGVSGECEATQCKQRPSQPLLWST